MILTKAETKGYEEMYKSNEYLPALICASMCTSTSTKWPTESSLSVLMYNILLCAS